MNLFRIAGIQLAVHVTFFLLLAYRAWEGWRDAGWTGVAFNTAMILLLFTCVILHEFGHALTARRFGVRVPRILLLPIGGMAQFESIPREPAKELAITIAGPAVNFALAALLWLFVPIDWELLDAGYVLSWTTIWQDVLIVNLFMGCFNLVPVFPMDGGRIFRALLATRIPYLQATRWAANIGKVLAILGAVLMVVYWENYVGALLFLFIYMAGGLEYRALQRQVEVEAHWAATLARLHVQSLSTAATAGPPDLPPRIGPPQLGG